MFDLLHTQTPVVTNYFSPILLTFTIDMPRTSLLNLNNYFIVFKCFSSFSLDLPIIVSSCFVFKQFSWSLNLFSHFVTHFLVPLVLFPLLYLFCWNSFLDVKKQILDFSIQFILSHSYDLWFFSKLAQFIVRWIKWFFYIIFNKYTVNYETIHISLTLTLIFIGVLIPELAHNLIDA